MCPRHDIWSAFRDVNLDLSTLHRTIEAFQEKFNLSKLPDDNWEEFAKGLNLIVEKLNKDYNFEDLKKIIYKFINYCEKKYKGRKIDLLCFRDEYIIATLDRNDSTTEKTIFPEKILNKKELKIYNFYQGILLEYEPSRYAMNLRTGTETTFMPSENYVWKQKIEPFFTNETGVEHFQKIMNPTDNDFKLITFNALKKLCTNKYYNNEVWTDNKCLLIKERLVKDL